jgi:hypothetical protein
MKKLIQKYINKITVTDVEMFAINNNIKLNKNETSAIYSVLKEHYNNLLYGNSEIALNILKNKLSNENYNKVYSLFMKYKEKYNNYL